MEPDIAQAIEEGRAADRVALGRKRRAMAQTASGRAMQDFGIPTTHMVASTGDRPTDASHGQTVHVEGGTSYVWNAQAGSAGAWEAA